jgi:hypothetical protein
VLSPCYDVVMAVTFRKPFCSQARNDIRKTNCSLEWNPFLILVCALFNGVFGISVYVALNGRVISESQIGKGVKGNGRDLIWTTLVVFASRNWRESRNLSMTIVSECPDRDSNRPPQMLIAWANVLGNRITFLTTAGQVRLFGICGA